MLYLQLQSLWVERTTLTLVQSLPGISRWFEVDKRELVSETQSCHAADANAVIYFAQRNLKKSGQSIGRLLISAVTFNSSCGSSREVWGYWTHCVSPP